MNLLDVYSEDELLITNVNFLRLGGKKLAKKAWLKDRGLRVRQDYMYSYVDDNGEDQQEVKASEIYTYEFKNEGREVSSYSRRMDWFDNGEVILTQDTTPDLTIDHLSDVNKSARNAQIEYLEISADNLRNIAATLPEDHPYKEHFIDVANSIDILLNHYEVSSRKYRERKLHTMDFETAVTYETNPQILAIHVKVVRLPDASFPTGLNVVQAIMYQLRGLIPS